MLNLRKKFEILLSLAEKNIKISNLKRPKSADFIALVLINFPWFANAYVAIAPTYTQSIPLSLGQPVLKLGTNNQNHID